MIQRIQTVYLLLAAMALALFVAFGLPDAQALETLSWMWWVVAGFVVLAALVCVGAVSLYSNRPRQRRTIAMAQWLVLLALLGLAAMFALVPALRETLMDLYAVLGYALLLVAYLFVRLALRGVDRDIALVRSMDRLR